MFWFEGQSAIQAAQGSSKVDLIITNLAAGALGLIGTLLTLAAGWLKERENSAKRSQRLDEAIKRVTFWEGWLKAIEPLDSGSEAAVWKDRARKQILSASDAIELLLHDDAIPKNLAKKEEDFLLWRQELPWWRRWLLLYKPARERAWIPRAIFYGYLIVTLLMPLLLYVQVTLRLKFAREEYQTRLNTSPLKNDSTVKELEQSRDVIAVLETYQNVFWDFLKYLIPAIPTAAFFGIWSRSLERPLATPKPVP
jgi:hypothetical protein